MYLLLYVLDYFYPRKKASSHKFDPKLFCFVVKMTGGGGGEKVLIEWELGFFSGLPDFS
jgi:hypothetical protein